MNPTIEKFGYPATLVEDFEHWLVLLRPAQPTLGSLVLAAKKYYRIPVRNDIDRAQLPAWMNEHVNEMPLDWDLLRKQSSDWLRYWDTEIRGRSKK